MLRILFSTSIIFLMLSSCKSKACECADAYVSAAKEMNKVSDPVKKIEILGQKKYKGIFQKCNQMTQKMSNEELKEFELEYKECPSVKSMKIR